MPRNEGVVGKRTIRNFDFLYSLSRCKDPQQKWEMIRKARRNQLLSIVDICSNLLSKNFKLSKSEERKLENYSDFLKKLARVKTEHGAKRLILKGEGIRIVKKRVRKNGKGQKGYGWKTSTQIMQDGKGGFLPALLVPVLMELAATAKDEILKRIS